MRYLVALGLLACACNSAPKNACATGTNSVVSSGQPASTCNGLCVDAGAEGVVCIADCTDGGNGVCSTGYACASGEPWSPKSFCLPYCAALDGGAASCPSPLACNDAGICAP